MRTSTATSTRTFRSAKILFKTKATSPPAAKESRANIQIQNLLEIKFKLAARNSSRNLFPNQKLLPTHRREISQKQATKARPRISLQSQAFRALKDSSNSKICNENKLKTRRNKRGFHPAPKSAETKQSPRVFKLKLMPPQISNQSCSLKSETLVKAFTQTKMYLNQNLNLSQSLQLSNTKWMRIRF